VQKRFFENLLSTVTTQLTAAGIQVPQLTIDNYDSVLNGVIKSINDKIYNQALEQVTSAVEEKRDYIKSQVTLAVRDEVKIKLHQRLRRRLQKKLPKQWKNRYLNRLQKTVRENVEAQAILAVTGMDKATYYEAVSKGLVDKETQNTINSTVNKKWEVQKF
jgi:hypothetical protein